MQRTIVIAVDEDVFAHFIEARLVQVLGALPGVRVVLPDHVSQTRSQSEANKRDTVLRALAADLITIQPAEELASIALYAAMRRRMSHGQAACIAMAQTRGMHVATDDRTVLYREAIVRIGAARLHTTFDLLARAVAAGLLTEAQSTQTKTLLHLKEPRPVVVSTESQLVYRVGDDRSPRKIAPKTR